MQIVLQFMISGNARKVSTRDGWIHTLPAPGSLCARAHAPTGGIVRGLHQAGGSAVSKKSAQRLSGKTEIVHPTSRAGRSYERTCA